MKLDESLQSLRIDDILERHAARERRKNPCPVGRKFVTEKAKRIEYGLSVTTMSMDTTVASQDTTQDSLEESWIGVFTTSSRKNRMELLKKRRSLTRKTAQSMGGNFNQFTMPVPKFNPNIQYLPSCSEDSDEEETVNDNVSLEVVEGRKGRPGQGCSTPKRGNNTLGMLKHIDVSAVSFNSTVPQVVAHPVTVVADETNRTVEVMEVDETVKEGDTLDAFRMKVPVIQPVNNGTYTITDGPSETTPVPGQGTFVIEEKDVETTAGTYTVHKDGGTFTIQDGTLDVPPKDKRPAKPTVTLSSALDKALSQRPTLFREKTMVGAKKLVEEVDPVVKEPKLSILASGGRKSNYNKRQSVQFATEIPSPASVSFGYSSTRTAKNPRFVPLTPTRNELASKTFKATDVVKGDENYNTSFGKTDTSTILETTPKRTPSARRSKILRTETPDRVQPPATTVQSGPRYAQHTVASFAKSPGAKDGSLCQHFKSFNESSKDSSGISTFIECDPNQIMVDATLRSGYRPRAQSRFAVQERLKQLNSDMDDDDEAKAALEVKRRNFLERRLNGTRNEEKTLDAVENVEVEKQQQSVTVDILSEVPLTLASIREEKDEEVLEEPASERTLPMEEETTPARAALLKRVSDFGELPDPYENDDAASLNSTKDEGIVIRQSQKPVEFDSVYSPNATAAPEEEYIKQRRIPNDENSIVEDETGYGVEMILKPRKIIRPVSPENEGLRRSKRNRMAPVRQWMGEKAVYKSSPHGSKRLVGSNKVVVTDPRYVHTRTTDPVKALNRERKYK